MARLGKGKDNLTLHVDLRLKGYIQVRAQRIDLTKSKFALKIVQWWLQSGAPPVTEGERLLPAIGFDAALPWENVLMGEPVSVFADTSQPSASSEAARLLDQQRSAALAKDGSEQSTHEARKQSRNAP